MHVTILLAYYVLIIIHCD